MKFNNGWHPSKKNYIEWWYFTLFCKSGEHIAGAFSIRNKTPALWISVTTKRGRHIYFEKKYNIKQFSALKDRCNVRIGNNFIREINGKLQIHVNENDLDLFVEADKKTIWKNNFKEIKIIRNEKLKWLVPWLKGCFKGTVLMNGDKRNISGTLFQDHVWNNIGIRNMIINLKRWMWGILDGKNSSILFIKAEGIGKNIKFLAVKNKKGVSTYSSDVNPDDFDIKLCNNSCRRIEISMKGRPMVEVKLEHRHKIIMKRFPLVRLLFEKVLKFRKFHYLSSFTFGKDKGRAHIEIMEKR